MGLTGTSVVGAGTVTYSGIGVRQAVNAANSSNTNTDETPVTLSATENQAPIIPPPTIPQILPDFLVRLGLPQLTEEDRVLLSQYAFARTPDVERQLEERIFQEEEYVYNGWQGYGYFPPSAAFSHALDGLLGTEGYENLMGNLYREIDSETGRPRIYSILISLSEQEADKYIRMADEEFIVILAQAQKDTYLLPIGSQALIEAYDRFGDLQCIALAKGISLKEFYYNDLMSSLPGLSERDYQLIYKLEIIAGTPENADDMANRGMFVESLRHFVESYLESTDSSIMDSLSGALYYLYNMAPKFGISPAYVYQVLQEIAEDKGLSLQPEGSVESLSDLENQSISVAPEGLPQEVKEILQTTGYWELVRTNVREIYLTPEIDEGRGIYSRDAGGMANPALHSVQIDTIYTEGTLKSDWDIAATLVHEAAHVEWSENAAIELQYSTPDERNAYLIETDFLMKYKDILHSQTNANNPMTTLIYGNETLSCIQQIVISNLLAVRGANYVLGYSLDDFTVKYDVLPSVDYLNSRGLQNLSELDMSHYPTDLAYMALLDPETFGLQFTQEELLTTLIRFINPYYLDHPDEIGQLLTVLEQILNDGARLEGSMVVKDGDREFEHYERRMNLTLIRSDGTQEDLAYLDAEATKSLILIFEGLKLRRRNSSDILENIEWQYENTFDFQYTTIDMLQALTSFLVAHHQLE